MWLQSLRLVLRTELGVKDMPTGKPFLREAISTTIYQAAPYLGLKQHQWIAHDIVQLIPNMGPQQTVG
jgi:hypothetical protein